MEIQKYYDTKIRVCVDGEIIKDVKEVYVKTHGDDVEIDIKTKPSNYIKVHRLDGSCEEFLITKNEGPNLILIPYED